MNKFAKLFAGMAVISLAASCSSDEPMGNNGGNDNADGVLYMAVNIQDAASYGKADNDGDGTDDDADGGYGNLNPTEAEHKVNSARFFFFDAQGVFVTEANVWSGYSNENLGGKTDNIELTSTTMIVLKGLKDKSLPKYLFTVVNCPDDFTAAATLAETAKKTSGIYNGNNFVMSTSSFQFAASATPANDHYDAKYPYANVVLPGDFYTEPKAVADVENPVVVYVERLATKTTFLFPDNSDGEWTVDVTVAGAPNNEANNDDIAKTTLKVKIDGLAVTNVESESYMAKNLDNFLANGTLGFNDKNLATNWTGWNNTTDHRSFWGMSTTYGKTGEALNLNHAKYSDAITAPFYSYETTNTLNNVKLGTETSGRVNDAQVPCAIFTATVTNADGSAVNLVEYAGVYYVENQFVKYGMNRLKADAGKLDFYTKDEANNLEQIDPKYVTIQKKVGAGTGVVELCANETALAGVELFNGEGTPTDIEALNARLAAFTNGETAPQAIAARDGKTYYTVPIRHLRLNTLGGKYQVNAEGQYGMVRNHWYQISINDISKLGHGVFTPDEVIIPEDPKDETYGLGAQINILSWKIVNQSVDL